MALTSNYTRTRAAGFLGSSCSISYGSLITITTYRTNPPNFLSIDGSEVDSSNYDRIVYPGMLIFFDWEQDGVPDHVGIITLASNDYIYTVEGNNGDAVVEDVYPVDSPSLYGFGVVG